MAYVFGFLSAMLLSVLATGITILFARSFLRSWCRTEIGRAAGDIALCGPAHVSRLGGAAMIIAFIGAMIIHPDLVLDRQWMVIIAALVVIAVIGIWDDLWPLSWRVQLFAQIGIAVFLFVLGVRITALTNPLGGTLIIAQESHFSFLALCIVVGWIVAVINTINWTDGVDGLSGVLVCICAITIAATALLPHVHQPPIAIVAAMLVGATCGFLLWNWFPARITAGTSGSFFWGLLIATLAIFAGAKIATTLLVMTIPFVDAVWVIGERLFAGTSIFAPDRRHLHHKLQAHGWKPWHIASIMGVVSALVAWSAVWQSTAIKSLVIGSVACMTIGVLIWLHYAEHSSKRKRND